MGYLWYPLGTYNQYKNSQQMFDGCSPTMRYIFIYDTAVVNLGNFSLLMFKIGIHNSTNNFLLMRIS
jgi:hypothetical protein